MALQRVSKADFDRIIPVDNTPGMLEARIKELLKIEIELQNRLLQASRLREILEQLADGMKKGLTPTGDRR
jgi:hypothetical protein